MPPNGDDPLHLMLLADRYDKQYKASPINEAIKTWLSKELNCNGCQYPYKKKDHRSKQPTDPVKCRERLPIDVLPMNNRTGNA